MVTDDSYVWYKAMGKEWKKLSENEEMKKVGSEHCWEQMRIHMQNRHPRTRLPERMSENEEKKIAGNSSHSRSKTRINEEANPGGGITLNLGNFRSEYATKYPQILHDNDGFSSPGALCAVRRGIGREGGARCGPGGVCHPNPALRPRVARRDKQEPRLRLGGGAEAVHARAG